jgi:hypothetical protein
MGVEGSINRTYATTLCDSLTTTRRRRKPTIARFSTYSDRVFNSSHLIVGCDVDYCLIKGTVPAGVVVPIHSHAERETFYVVEGKVQGALGGSLDHTRRRWGFRPGALEHGWQTHPGRPPHCCSWCLRGWAGSFARDAVLSALSNRLHRGRMIFSAFARQSRRQRRRGHIGELMRRIVEPFGCGLQDRVAGASHHQSLRQSS